MSIRRVVGGGGGDDGEYDEQRFRYLHAGDQSDATVVRPSARSRVFPAPRNRVSLVPTAAVLYRLSYARTRVWLFFGSPSSSHPPSPIVDDRTREYLNCTFFSYRHTRVTTSYNLPHEHMIYTRTTDGDELTGLSWSLQTVDGGGLPRRTYDARAISRMSSPRSVRRAIRKHVPTTR